MKTSNYTKFLNLVISASTNHEQDEYGRFNVSAAGLIRISDLDNRSFKIKVLGTLRKKHNIIYAGKGRNPEGKLLSVFFKKIIK